MRVFISNDDGEMLVSHAGGITYVHQGDTDALAFALFKLAVGLMKPSNEGFDMPDASDIREIVADGGPV